MLEQSVTNSSSTTPVNLQSANLTIPLSQKEILEDFATCCLSREASLLARKEVLTGKAKFGIVGDGKEVPQVAMARAFKNGDFRSGYYRDQTFMFALGLSTIEDFFAQLYADPENDPFSGGRQMNSHYATKLVDEEGNWTDHKNSYNISSDISSTGGQMARALGLALASKQYRNIPSLAGTTNFSDHGNEVCFCTIGDASTSEGVFWETVNAACVQRVPLAISVWDDGYGISVPIKFQTTKQSISKALSGFALNKEGEGMHIFVEKAWNYPALVKLYQEGIAAVRKTHIPALFHITEVTQPQGHSTSGSHERYKTKERLHWEREHDCIVKMEAWIIEENIATAEELEAIRKNARRQVRESRDRAWQAFNTPTREAIQELKAIYSNIPDHIPSVAAIKKSLERSISPLISELTKSARQMQFAILGQPIEANAQLTEWISQRRQQANEHYHSKLYSDSSHSALRVAEVRAQYPDKPVLKNGYEILNAFFDTVLKKDPAIMAFGEDVGKIGDVNQGFANMQKKYGKDRIFDTGIREWTIMGQAIGMAMRGLRPIAEIQYLDYLVYGLQPLMDDLATLRYRSNGIQQAPAIIRTRGHRLEGIWHAGSPLGMLLNALRGMYVLVPRNMVQAAGMYNTMLQSDDPALIIECLNGYRLKEKMPENIGQYTVPLGIPDVIQEGHDVTLVTYGSCVRIAEEALPILQQYGISVELIDVQTLLPFDQEHRILQSLQKTNRIVFLDEDVPGGASAYMMQQVLEVQKGYQFLDSAPKTITAKAHRPPYGSDGDYFSKPNAEDVFEGIYQMLYEVHPHRFEPLK